MEAAGPCQQAPDGQVSTWYQWKRKLMELGREDKNDTGNTGTENCGGSGLLLKLSLIQREKKRISGSRRQHSETIWSDP